MSRKLTELTQVADASGNTLFYLVDLDRALTDQAVSIDIDDLKTLLDIPTGIRPRTVTTASIATTYDLDMALGLRFDLTLTANTTISISNLLVDGDSNQMYVTLGGFALTLPAFFNAYPNSEDITGATLIMIVWDVLNAGSGTEDVRYNAVVVV